MVIEGVALFAIAILKFQNYSILGDVTSFKRIFIIKTIDLLDLA
jgi:hypothetical protein